MKIQSLFILAAVCVSHACSVSDEDGTKGWLVLHFSPIEYAMTKAVSSEIPDTSDFILDITDSKGKSIYNGKYGDSPESLLVNAGTYNVSVRSCEFDKPKFSAPQYGDDQCVIVPSGGVGRVSLTCAQINCGIKIRIASNFLTTYPDGVIFAESEDGSLMYGYSERRIAYFKPGKLSVVLKDGGSKSTLFTRNLASREVLSVGISAPKSSSQSPKGTYFSVEVDTLRSWRNESYVIGGSSSSGGTGSDDAMDVSSAKKAIGKTGLWVYGYVVGAFKGSSSFVDEGPFEVSTNLAIASRTTVSGKESCLSVELKKGSVRDALNLMDNPDILGTKIYVKGDIVESYFGIPGIKNVSDCKK